MGSGIGRVLWVGCFFFFFGMDMDFWSGGGCTVGGFPFGWFICATMIFFAVRIRDSKASEKVSSKDRSFLEPQMQYV